MLEIVRVYIHLSNGKLNSDLDCDNRSSSQLPCVPNISKNGIHLLPSQMRSHNHDVFFLYSSLALNWRLRLL